MLLDADGDVEADVGVVVRNAGDVEIGVDALVPPEVAAAATALQRRGDGDKAEHVFVLAVGGFPGVGRDGDQDVVHTLELRPALFQSRLQWPARIPSGTSQIEMWDKLVSGA